MKTSFLSALLIIALLCGCSQTSNTTKSLNPLMSATNVQNANLQEILTKVRAQFVPDRRVNVFDISVKNIEEKTVLKGATTVAEAKDELLKLARLEDANIVDSIVILPAENLGDEVFGVVTLSVASIRTSGEYSAEMATQAVLGTPVKILQNGSWLRVQTPEGYIGYTYATNIKRMNKQQFNAWTVAPKIIFTDNYGFAYTEPNTTDVVSDLCVGNMIKLEDEIDQYYKISFPDGRVAYVNKNQAKKVDDWYESIELTGENIVAYGKRFMGVPYLWGGTSSKSLDCSGFSKVVYSMHGIILQRDASQQYLTGTPIDISENYDNLKAGDLLFFGSRAENGRRERIGHVGIYIGNNLFIHEATQVKINSLDPAAPNYDKYNASRVVCASRIIGAVDTKGITTIKSNEFYQEQK